MLKDTINTVGEQPQREREDLGKILRNAGLSNREIDVVEFVIKGLSNKQVGENLCIAEKTVKFHLTHVYKNLSIRSRAELIVWCFSHLNFIETRVAAPASTTATTIPTVSPADTIPAGNTTVAQPNKNRSGFEF